LGCWFTRGKQTNSGPASFLALLLLASLVVLAAIVRMIATRNDLWLDEIISLRIANAVKTPWQIFSVVHSDNNHYLNTLFLYYVKTQNYAPVYRYLSVLWGVLLVPAGYWLLVQRSRVEALILAGILASSYPLIHFSSEARGYSGALLGSMLACAALAQWMAREDGKGRSFFLGLAYGMAMVLAILSHLTACLICLCVGGYVVGATGSDTNGTHRTGRSAGAISGRTDASLREVFAGGPWTVHGGTAVHDDAHAFAAAQRRIQSGF
jgi:hypothetical protein